MKKVEQKINFETAHAYGWEAPRYGMFRWAMPDMEQLKKHSDGGKPVYDAKSCRVVIVKASDWKKIMKILNQGQR